MLHVLCHGLQAYLVFIYNAFGKPKQKLSTAYSFALIFTAHSLLTVIVLYILFCRHGSSSLHGINQFINQDRVITRKLERKYNTKLSTKLYIGFVDNLVFMGLSYVSIQPLFITLFAMFHNIDALSFIFEEFLPSAYYRSMTTILLCKLFRAICLFLAMGEALWCVSEALIAGYIVVMTMHNSLKLMFLIGDHVSIFLKQYTNSWLAFNMLRAAANEAFFVIIANIFWITVISLTIMSVSYKELPLSIYLIITVIAALILLVTIITFWMLTKLSLLCTELLKTKWLKALLFIPATPYKRKQRIYLTSIKCLGKIQFAFGNVFPIDANAAEAYFRQLLGNWITAVLLLKSFVMAKQ